MIRNTEDLIDNLKFWAGITAIATAGLVGLAIVEIAKRRKQYHRPYNPDTFEEVTGQITKVTTTGKNEHSSKGVILTLATDDGELPVHLGPTWFITHQFNRFKTGNKVVIGGSRIRYHGRDILVASTLQLGKNRFRLRDKKGQPYWQSKIKE